MFKYIKSKNNKKLSNPFHSSYKKHLVERSKFEIKTEEFEKAYKNKVHTFMSAIKLCFYKKNILKNIKRKYNNYVYRDVVINSYHTPSKNSFLRKVYIRRIPENILLKTKPYLGLFFIPFYPLYLFISKAVMFLYNRKIIAVNKKINKKHFTSFKQMNRYNIFSIKANKRRIKKEMGKVNIFQKFLFNKTSIVATIFSLSIAGGVVANPSYDNRNIKNIFNEGGDVTMQIYPSDHIDNIDFSKNSISAYYSNNSNVSFYLPSDAKFNGKENSSLINVKANYSGKGNYIHKTSKKEKDWFQNIGIVQDKCSSSLFLVNLKHINGEDGRFNVRTNRLSEPNRMIDVVYEIKESKVLYYIKDYDYYTRKRNKVASFVCEVSKDEALHNQINTIVKKM